MKVLEVLLNRRWILKSRERELYYQVKEALASGEEKKFLREKLGYQVLINPYMIKVEKLPAVPENWMGISDFRDPIAVSYTHLDCPSERGRNYTPLREVVHCALPGASCGQQMISVDFQSAPIITGEATLPLRWLCQLPLCGLAARKSFRKPIPFSKLKLYNSASDKSELPEDI